MHASMSSTKPTISCPMIGENAPELSPVTGTTFEM